MVSVLSMAIFVYVFVYTEITIDDMCRFVFILAKYLRGWWWLLISFVQSIIILEIIIILQVIIDVVITIMICTHVNIRLLTFWRSILWPGKELYSRSGCSYRLFIIQHTCKKNCNQAYQHIDRYFINSYSFIGDFSVRLCS